MKALIATDFRLYEIDGKLFLNDTTYTTVERYKNIFGKVILCTRVIRNAQVSSKLKDATLLIDSYIAIDNFIHVLLGKYDSLIRKYITSADIIIARVPSIIAYRVSRIAHQCEKPVLALAMGCAWDVYWNHSLAGKIIAPYMYWEMRRTLKNSDYALYVTSEFLQKRYPCCCKINMGISDVRINKIDKDIIDRRILKIQERYTDSDILLMTTGDVSSKIKGQKFAIEAIKMLKDDGIIVNYVLVGEGDKKYLTNIADKLGVKNQLIFTGRLNYGEVIEMLDKADIYIQPSLSEGLPRAVVEAMSRGCPVIASSVGGNPELIDSRYLVSAKSAKDIYIKLKDILHTNQMINQAYSNFERAKQFENEFLSKKRNNFFDLIKEDMNKKG